MGNTDTQKTRKLLVGVVLITLGLYAVISGILNATDNVQPLVAPSGAIRVEIVDTNELRSRGLSGRESIGDNGGMLFVFEEPSDSHCLWMKDMLFAIDMVWLDNNKKVINSFSNIEPDSYPQPFCPEGDAQYALEVQAGRAEELGFVNGALVRF